MIKSNKTHYYHVILKNRFTNQYTQLLDNQKIYQFCFFQQFYSTTKRN